MLEGFIYFIGYIVLLVGGGYAITRKWEDAPSTALMKKSEDLNQITNQYNEMIVSLAQTYTNEKNFQEETQGRMSAREKRKLKEKYSDYYNELAGKYKQKRQHALSQWEQSHPLWMKARQAWAIILTIGAFSGVPSCIHQLILEEEQATASSAMSQTEERYWNADNIPMPHLQDASQYVSNPDYVLTQQSVDRMNATLCRLDSVLGIESVVIIVNHIENDDPYRMAQDVGNKYGVGRNDRGLVVVVGYQDHSVNISPGRSLEGDLTDAECNQLEQRYVIPAMRADMPDSAMIYLTEAIYAHMEKKELPQMSSLLSSDDEDDQSGILMGLYTLFYALWGVLFVRLNQKYNWVGLAGTSDLIGNPFYEASESSSIIGGGGGRGGGGFSGGGGGFSGGSFGGGSFGGGGATSRW